MSALYLVSLLISTACMVLIDWRFRLFFWHAPVRAAIVTVSGLVFLLVWDVIGIVTGLFRHLDSQFATGVLVAPDLPIEEVLFLTFLSYLTMVLVLGARRLLRVRRRVDAE